MEGITIRFHPSTPHGMIRVSRTDSMYRYSEESFESVGLHGAGTHVVFLWNICLRFAITLAPRAWKSTIEHWWLLVIKATRHRAIFIRKSKNNWFCVYHAPRLAKKLAPIFHPIRNQNQTRDSLAIVFPRFASATSNYWVLIGSNDTRALHHLSQYNQHSNHVHFSLSSLFNIFKVYYLHRNQCTLWEIFFFLFFFFNFLVVLPFLCEAQQPHG